MLKCKHTRDSEEVIELRVLVAISDRARSRHVCSLLARREPEWDVMTVHNGSAALLLLRRERFDLLLLHFCLAGADGTAILDLLPMLPCPPRTLLLCEPEFGRRRTADCVAPLYADDESICRLLSTLSQRPVPRAACVTRELRRDWINETLQRLSLPASLKGYAYLAWMLERLAPSPALESRVADGLYAPCALAFDTSTDAVERCVRHAIERAFTVGNLRGIEALFGATVDPDRGKPTNRAFLLQLAERLRQECYSLAVARSPNSSEMHHRPAAPTSV